MDKTIRIPVNVKSKYDQPEVHSAESPSVSDAREPVSAFEDVQEVQEAEGAPRGRQNGPAGQGDGRHDVPAQQAAQQRPQPTAEHARPAAAPDARGEAEEWRDRALRLQAEMDNFRKRQQRLAQDQIQGERERLLRSFLPVIDNLERALSAQSANGGGLREGVELTHRAALQLLQREDVQRIQGKGEPFDPNWQEAVTTVDHRQAGVEPNAVVDVLETGYRYGDQLLRPARVVVAV